MLKYFSVRGGWVGGKIIPRIRLTSAKVLLEVEAELGNRTASNSMKEEGGLSYKRFSLMMVTA